MFASPPILNVRAWPFMNRLLKEVLVVRRSRAVLSLVSINNVFQLRYTESVVRECVRSAKLVSIFCGMFQDGCFFALSWLLNNFPFRYAGGILKELKFDSSISLTWRARFIVSLSASEFNLTFSEWKGAHSIVSFSSLIDSICVRWYSAKFSVESSNWLTE